MKITKEQARRFFLAHQRLWQPRRLEGKAGVIDYIGKVGCIQFDPLNMVGYNPDLVLQSRVKNYQPSLLQELLYSDRKLLDGWDKNMAIYAVEDWPYFSRYREEAHRSYGDASSPIHEILPEVRKTLEQHGPSSSIDFKFDTKVDWAWAPTRISRAALESMYFWGELIIHHKIGTRRVYDFANKHLPSHLLSMADPNETMEQYYDWNVKRRIGAVGLLWGRPSDAWLGIKWMKSKERTEAFTRLLKNGELLTIEVEDIPHSLSIRKEEIPLLDEIDKGVDKEPQASFIAPLDNLLWDRKLIQALFGFEYTWEVYKPVSERKYGYYVLPILYGDRFVGRFEPKLDKKTKKLEIINWWWEPDVTMTDSLKQALSSCLKAFIGYLGAKDIQLNAACSRKNKLGWLLRMMD
ncbi:MAG: winged helix-turn-helix domain-containing protein [Bacillota bacterium]